MLHACSGKSANGGDLSGVLAADADFSKADFKEAQMSKAYARVRAALGLLRLCSAMLVVDPNTCFSASAT